MRRRPALAKLSSLEFLKRSGQQVWAGAHRVSLVFLIQIEIKLTFIKQAATRPAAESYNLPV